MPERRGRVVRIDHVFFGGLLVLLVLLVLLAFEVELQRSESNSVRWKVRIWLEQAGPTKPSQLSQIPSYLYR